MVLHLCGLIDGHISPGLCRRPVADAFGYKVVDAGRRGGKIKRKLAAKESEAKVVRLIFDLYLGEKQAAHGVLRPLLERFRG